MPFEIIVCTDVDGTFSASVPYGSEQQMESSMDMSRYIGDWTVIEAVAYTDA